MFNYENYLINELNAIAHTMNYDGKIIVVNEQEFVDEIFNEHNTIYFIVKHLGSTITYEGKSTPLQITIISEANSLEMAQAIATEFASSHNWETYTNGVYMKQQYSTPAVISNFNDVSNEYRSLLYFSGYIFIIDDILDLTSLTITLKVNNVDTAIEVKPSDFQFDYAMQGNTQPVGGNKISTTTKSTSTNDISIVVPAIEKYKALIQKALDIAKGEETGNFDFPFKYTLCGVSFHFNYKLVSCKFATKPNQIPSFILGFMR